MQGCEWTEMLVQILMRDIFRRLPEYQGMVEVRNRDVVPGETGRSASFESRDVVYEVGDDHFHDLRREPTRLERVCVDIWIPAREYGPEFGFGTVPNGVGETPDAYDRLITERDSRRDAAGLAGYLITRT